MDVGGRLFPLFPNFTLGSLAVRGTASAGGGFAFVGQASPQVAFSAGAHFSFDDDPTGVMFEVVYRPIPTEPVYNNQNDIIGTPCDDGPDVMATISPSWTLRAGFVF